MIDFTGLAEFDVAALKHDATGKALLLPLNKIESDPDQIRTSIDPEELQGLAASIESVGLIQPICVRRHPMKKDHYIINAGERRWRAVGLLKRPSIEAYIRDDVDPFVQAAENIQREGLSPKDLARFVTKHENLGMSRAEIARKLGKPKSFITEAAWLADAPKAVLAAIDQGRVPDTRTAYLLAKAWNSQGDVVKALLADKAPLTREAVSEALGGSFLHARMAPTEKKSAVPKGPSAKPWNALAVEVKGRKGRLSLRPGPNRSSAEVWFDDGAREKVALSDIRLLTWTTLK